MAKELRKRIESIVKNKDIFQLELQHFTRQLLKKSNRSKKRRDYLYQILNDKKINEFLDNGEVDEAHDYVTQILENLN